MKKPRTPAQLANDERLKAMAKAHREAQQPVTEPPVEDVTDVQDKPDLAALQSQINEIMETNALLKAALLNRPQAEGNGLNIGRTGQILGEVDKYLVDPANYPDPTKRLANEARLQTIAFNHNYELAYKFSVRPYETKTGINMREPEFELTLWRVALDDQGNRVQIKNKEGVLQDKLYRARRLMFHEDPQAALVIARENNILVDKEDEKAFLDEMRYLRTRDWLFDFFWPKKADSSEGVTEESIGGTIVEVFYKNSEDPSSVDFDKLHSKF